MNYLLPIFFCKLLLFLYIFNNNECIELIRLYINDNYSVWMPKFIPKFIGISSFNDCFKKRTEKNIESFEKVINDYLEDDKNFNHFMRLMYLSSFNDSKNN